MYQLHKNFPYDDGYYVVEPTFEPDPNGTACYTSGDNTTRANMLLYGDFYDSEDNLVEANATVGREYDLSGDQSASYCLSYVLGLPEYSGYTEI